MKPVEDARGSQARAGRGRPPTTEHQASSHQDPDHDAGPEKSQPVPNKHAALDAGPEKSQPVPNKHAALDAGPEKSQPVPNKHAALDAGLKKSQPVPSKHAALDAGLKKSQPIPSKHAAPSTGPGAIVGGVVQPFVISTRTARNQTSGTEYHGTTQQLPRNETTRTDSGIIQKRGPDHSLVRNMRQRFDVHAGASFVDLTTDDDGPTIVPPRNATNLGRPVRSQKEAQAPAPAPAVSCVGLTDLPRATLALRGPMTPAAANASSSTTGKTHGTRQTAARGAKRAIIELDDEEELLADGPSRDKRPVERDIRANRVHASRNVIQDTSDSGYDDVEEPSRITRSSGRLTVKTIPPPHVHAARRAAKKHESDEAKDNVKTRAMKKEDESGDVKKRIKTRAAKKGDESDDDKEKLKLRALGLQVQSDDDEETAPPRRRLDRHASHRRILRPDLEVPELARSGTSFKTLVKFATHVKIDNDAAIPFNLDRLCAINMECVTKDRRLSLQCSQCHSVEFSTIKWPEDKPRVPAGGGHTFRILTGWIYHELRPHHHFEFDIPEKIAIVIHTLLNADGLLDVLFRDWDKKYGDMTIEQVTHELQHIQRTKMFTPRFKTLLDKGSTQSRRKDGLDEYPSFDYEGYIDFSYRKPNRN